MTIDPFSGPILSGLFGDREIGAFLGIDATLQNMLRVEAAYAQAFGQAGKIPTDIAHRAAKGKSTCPLDPTDLYRGMAVDGVCIPAMIRKLKTKSPPELHVAVHRGLTSKDVIDTSLILALKPVIKVMETRLQALKDAFADLESRFGAQPVQAHTRTVGAPDHSHRPDWHLEKTNRPTSTAERTDQTGSTCAAAWWPRW